MEPASAIGKPSVHSKIKHRRATTTTTSIRKNYPACGKEKCVAMDALLLIARLMMASLFLAGGIPKLRGDPGARQAIASLGLPAPGFLERLTGFGLVAGAAMLAFGVWTRPAAALLAAFVVVVTPLLLRFWVVEDAQQRARLTQAFAGNIGVVGGLLAFVAVGPGSMALLPGT